MKWLLAALVLLNALAMDLHGQEAPKKYALLIAVTRYRHAEMNKPQLQYPEIDAKAVGAVLEANGYEVDLLLGSDATLEGIKAKLSHLVKQGNDNGAVVVGLWGHGVEFSGEDKPLFCPYDAQLRIATYADGSPVRDSQSGLALNEPDPKSLLDMGEVLAALGACGAKNRVLLADCCRSSPHTPRGRTFGAGVTVAQVPPNTAVLLACSANEKAYEHETWRHGAFTKALLDLLPVMAAEQQDVPAITGKLIQGVKALLAASFDKRTTQTPHSISNGNPSLLLLKPKAVARSDRKAMPQGGMGAAIPPPPLQAAQGPMGAVPGVHVPASIAELFTTEVAWGDPVIVPAIKDLQLLNYLHLAPAVVGNLQADFELEIRFRHAGTTAFLLRSGASVRRFQIVSDRGIKLANAPLPIDRIGQLFPNDRPVIMTMTRKEGIINVSLQDSERGMIPVHQFRFDAPIQDVRIGLMSGGGVLGATSMPLGGIAPPVATQVIIEDFYNVASGQVPKQWKVPTGAMGVSRALGTPVLQRFATPSAVELPADVLAILNGDCVMECDFVVRGGGSHSPSPNLDLIFDAKSNGTGVFHCNAYRGMLQINNGQVPDAGRFGGGQSHYTVRFEKSGKRASWSFVPMTGGEPIVVPNVDVRATQTPTFRLGLSENPNDMAHILEFRIQQ